jgi:hypothetical protein
VRRLPRCLSLTAGLFRSSLSRDNLPFQLKHIVLGPSRTLLGPGTRCLNIVARALKGLRAGRQRVVVASASTRPPSGHGGAGSIPATG